MNKQPERAVTPTTFVSSSQDLDFSVPETGPSYQNSSDTQKNDYPSAACIDASNVSFGGKRKLPRVFPNTASEYIRHLSPGHQFVDKTVLQAFLLNQAPQQYLDGCPFTPLEDLSKTLRAERLQKARTLQRRYRQEQRNRISTLQFKIAAFKQSNDQLKSSIKANENRIGTLNVLMASLVDTQNTQ